MTVEMQPRIINGTSYDMPTVNGMDRCQINTRLHYINVEMDKLKARQAALLDARTELDRHAEMHSTTNLLPQTSTDEFMENTKECSKITGNLDLWQEMFGGDDGRGQDSAFMDDNFGG